MSDIPILSNRRHGAFQRQPTETGEEYTARLIGEGNARLAESVLRATAAGVENPIFANRRHRSYSRQTDESREEYAARLIVESNARLAETTYRTAFRAGQKTTETKGNLTDADDATN